jgi:methionine synthase II (cobalamin-independent)
MRSLTRKAPFRCDIVGSFLRPERLKEARASFARGTTNAQQLKSIEDECIRELDQKQKKIGLSVITDGEFRRS